MPDRFNVVPMEWVMQVVHIASSPYQITPKYKKATELKEHANRARDDKKILAIVNKYAWSV